MTAPTQGLKAPFPWFGGKRRIAPDIWAALGDTSGYVEPFAGSAAVLLARPSFQGRRAETLNDIDGWLCLDPATRVLGIDLHWRTIGDLRVGDQLVGFDEFNPGEARPGFAPPTRYRRFARSTVTATHVVRKPCYRLTFEDGTQVIASEDHMWLSGSHAAGGAANGKGGRAWRWLATKSLVCNRATQRSWVMKVCNVTEREDTYESGWLGGFFDGEGNVAHYDKTGGWRVTASQKAGPESDRCEKLLRDRGFQVVVKDRHPRKPDYLPQVDFFLQGKREVLRFLMLTRPERLIENLVRDIGHRSLYGREHEAVALVSKEFLGERDVVALTTDTHTYIAEGLASHNCNTWRALRDNPREVARHAFGPIIEADYHARLAWLRERRGAELVAWLEGDPEHYDAKAAGWWLYVASAGIGDPWNGGPWMVVDGKLVDTRITGHEDPNDIGIHRALPDLGTAGRGVNRATVAEYPAATDIATEHAYLLTEVPQPGEGEGIHLGPRGMQDFGHLVTYLSRISDRLSRVRITCGSWERMLSNAVYGTGAGGDGSRSMMFDPPYSVSADVYGAIDSEPLHKEVEEWCLTEAPEFLRIVVCGYDGEYPGLEAAGWRVAQGKANTGGGYAKSSDNAQRERLWLSPACIQPSDQLGLF